MTPSAPAPPPQPLTQAMLDGWRQLSDRVGREPLRPGFEDAGPHVLLGKDAMLFIRIVHYPTDPKFDAQAWGWFFAAAPRAVPALLDEVARLRARLAAAGIDPDTERPSIKGVVSTGISMAPPTEPTP